MALAAKIENLSKDFPRGPHFDRVLHSINLDIRMGELTMLVGPSGCGKTTLISVMSGILSPTMGDIELLGKPFNRLRDKEKVLFRREHIGFIFQQFNLLPALTAAENAAMPLFAAGVPDREAVAQGVRVLQEMGMDEHVDKLPRELSGGQQQRVAIARAIVHNPPFIICDEPTASLDAKTGLTVMQILRGIANNPGCAVLVVTHDSRIYRFADRILEMSDGRIMGDHLPQEFQPKD